MIRDYNGNENRSEFIFVGKRYEIKRKENNMSVSGQTPGVLHKSLVQTIVENIEDRILIGELKPGERLTEKMMCDILEVSRSPLREAFRILENQGFLVNKARRGVFVSQLTQKEAIDIYTIRANLESLATYLAVKTENHDLVVSLRKILDEMKNAAECGDSKKFLENNFMFHETLVSSCNNGLLIEMLKRFNKQTARYRAKILSSPGKPAESIKSHEQLIDSIESGDATRAELIRKNAILNNITLIERFFKNDKDAKES
jgi:DNA-binding GntR family transcriptional regulator